MVHFRYHIFQFRLYPSDVSSPSDILALLSTVMLHVISHVIASTTYKSTMLQIIRQILKHVFTRGSWVMVLAGRRGKRRDLFIFGTPYFEFLPVVQKSAPGSFLPLFIPRHMQDFVIWVFFFQVLQSDMATHVKLRFRKTVLRIRRNKNSTEVSDRICWHMVTPWICIVLAPVLNVPLTPAAWTVDFRDFSLT